MAGKTTDLVGDLGTMLPWDGSSWTGVSSGTTSSLAAVWGMAGTRCRAGRGSRPSRRHRCWECFGRRRNALSFTRWHPPGCVARSQPSPTLLDWNALRMYQRTPMPGYDYGQIPVGFYDEVMRRGDPVRRLW